MRCMTNIPGDRIWARVDRFVCECPNCAAIISPFHQDLGRQPTIAESGRRLSDVGETERAGGASAFGDRVYDPRSQSLRCPRCHETYAVGLLLYPVERGTRSVAAPPDTIPTPEQRRQLRAIKASARRRTARPHVP